MQFADDLACQTVLCKLCGHSMWIGDDWANKKMTQNMSWVYSCIQVLNIQLIHMAPIFIEVLVGIETPIII